jgi:cystathionine beta-lyase
MSYDFDSCIDRRSIANLNKWNWYPEDVLPLWIADMDFRTPEPILDALRAALDHGILGYEFASSSLLELVAGRAQQVWGWTIAPESIVALPNVNIGYRVAASSACRAGEGVLMQPPVFYDFVDFPPAYGLVRQVAPLRRVDQGQVIRYEFDLDLVRQAIHDGVKTGMFLLCNPHNPVGRIFSVDEMTRLASLCKEKDILLCSDDIHHELLLGEAAYTPIAALAPDIGERTITLFGPGKGYNMSGLGCAFAVIPDAVRRRRFTQELGRLSLFPSSAGLIAARVVYSGACDEWLAAVRAYLTANRDALVTFVKQELPGLATTIPDATYLAWVDCSEYIRAGIITGSPSEFFLKKAQVALSDGAPYGPGGESFVRLNFACPRAVLEEALQRIKQALARPH